MAGAEPIRLMVVDDHQIVRTGLVRLLEREPDLQVVGQFDSGEDGLDALSGLAVDVAILDYRMRGMNGAAACREILGRRPELAVIMYTAHLSDEVIHASLAAGARAYLTKATEIADVARAVRAVARGEVVLSPEVTGRVVRWARESKALPLDAGLLAPHEIEVLSLVARGFSNRQIARRMYRGEAAVKEEMRTIMRKVGARRRGDAVTVAIERGVI